MEHYLSRAILPMGAALQMKLADGYAWHRQIWLAFPGRPAAARDFLFRVDSRGGCFQVLLLSAVPPVSGQAMAWQTKPVRDDFLAGDRYRFQLKANPTFRRKSDERRLPILDEAKLRDWMARKAEQAGFKVALESLRLSAPQEDTFVDGKGFKGKHVFVDFEGLMSVADRAALAKAFYAGIGSAKGFGYGMLMLQPVHQ